MKRIMRRIFAICGVLLLLGLLGLTLFLAVTGSRYFLASMAAMIVLPILIYGYLILYRVISPAKQKEEDKEKDT